MKPWYVFASGNGFAIYRTVFLFDSYEPSNASVTIAWKQLVDGTVDVSVIRVLTHVYSLPVAMKA